jgi:hypothetical protein
MHQPTRSVGSAAILLRLAGFAYVLFGVGMLFVGYGIATGRPAVAWNISGWVITAISISVLGIAMIFLRRWAVVLLSACTLVFLWFLGFGVLFHVDLSVGVPVGLFYLILGAFPAVCTYFAWCDLK